jgi:hypothetical protein
VLLIKLLINYGSYYATNATVYFIYILVSKYKDCDAIMVYNDNIIYYILIQYILNINILSLFDVYYISRTIILRLISDKGNMP